MAAGTQADGRKVIARWGEEQATKFLRAQGQAILARNAYIHGVGELDLVTKHDDILCFVEVRTSTGDIPPLETITRRKQSRLIRAARAYLATAAGFHYEQIRFDVIGVTGTPYSNTPPHIEWIPAAFELTLA